MNVDLHAAPATIDSDTSTLDTTDGGRDFRLTMLLMVSCGPGPGDGTRCKLIAAARPNGGSPVGEHDSPRLAGVAEAATALGLGELAAKRWSHRRAALSAEYPGKRAPTAEVVHLGRLTICNGLDHRWRADHA
jgi:hypothetical protein